MGLKAHRGSSAFVLTSLALTWSVALVVGALVLPVYSGTAVNSSAEPTSTTATLVGENGLGVLIPVGIPAVVTLLVWVALRWRCSRGGRLSGSIAWMAIGLLAMFCVLAILSVGIFVLPVVLLLAGAAARTPVGAP
jgi:hypothetical protein